MKQKTKKGALSQTLHLIWAEESLEGKISQGKSMSQFSALPLCLEFSLALGDATRGIPS
jgi:hypothetical protein